MKLLCLMPLLMAAGAPAQDAAVFQAPKAYAVQRYEAGWSKNPFTLKTAPVPVANAAFAQDLIIGSFYGALEDLTVVLVNKKTHERFRLKRGESTPTGVCLAEVNVGRAHKDLFVQVSQAGETVTLRYDVVLASAAQPQTPTRPPKATDTGAKPWPSVPGGTRRLQTLVMSTPLLPP